MVAVVDADFVLFLPWEREPTGLLLIEAARTRGILARVVTPWDADPPAAREIEGRRLLPRLGQRALEAGLARLESLEAAGARAVNSAAAIRCAKNKAMLSSLGVRRPAGGLARGGEEPPLPFPFVVKSLHGARGSGVRLVTSAEEWASVAGAEDVIVERFVPPEEREEWRVLVLMGATFAACRRHPAVGEFRSNHALGGRAEQASPPAAVVELAEGAVARSGLGFAGVDVVVPRGKAPLLLDLNDSPGLVAISKVLERDLAGELVAVASRGPTMTS